MIKFNQKRFIVNTWIVLQRLICLVATTSPSYLIPVTINPLVQHLERLKDEQINTFYERDKKFFSKVTPLDASRSSGEPVKDTIQKKINVVFFTVVSAHVSKTMKLSNLKYTKMSKWSYSVDEQSILAASGGNLTSIDSNTTICDIQKYAMKVLEKKYKFNTSEILRKLNYDLSDYYAVDEKEWRYVVGFIVQNFLEHRTNTLQLTKCHLAEMINTSVTKMEEFTLNETDTYLYNTTMLLEKLPNYKEIVLNQLYKTFELSEAEFAEVTKTNISRVKSMTLNNILKLFTKSVLQKLFVTENEVAARNHNFSQQMLLSCPDRWHPFIRIIVNESFHNAAEKMSIDVDALSSLINKSYSVVQNYSVNEMINLLEKTIICLSNDKKILETLPLQKVIEQLGSINVAEKDVFEVIYWYTNFTENQLTVLYNWSISDYLFSAKFTLDDVNMVCKVDSMKTELLTLATFTVGSTNNSCNSFTILRKISEGHSVSYLENKYSSKELLLNISVSQLINQLTRVPSNISHRVVNVSGEAENLISSFTLNDIIAASMYQSSHLKSLSFQAIIDIMVELYNNGSFHQKVVSFIILHTSCYAVKN